ncbi:MAG: pyridoxal phosphate enzyme (YggS family) [Marinoscillum sp.]|jgi:pyridoxal phosphate enzyme (YggS family)
MNHIKKQIQEINNQLSSSSAKLIAVSKTQPLDNLMAAYECGQREFGENKVQELCDKYEALPKDINWHMIGHLQRNKVKYIAPFVHLIHSVDSLKLLKEINKEGEKNNKIISCLLQVHIAQESTKFGFDKEDLLGLIDANALDSLQHVKVIGLMGMATFTEDESLVSREFASLKSIFEELKALENVHLSMTELSMGMSGDYPIAIENGSTFVRVGSSIFGERNYG